MNRIALLGARGSGKTSVGPLVAATLGWTFQDADTVLEANAGRTIAEIFASDGEAAFRDLEQSTLETLLKESNIVIATGGGIVMRPANRELLSSRSFNVWLDASPELCWQRIQADSLTASRRPNLAGGGLDEVRALMSERAPSYEDLADLRVEASASPNDIAARIFQVCGRG